MKILLLGKVPAYFEQFRKVGESFPYFQAQSSWIRALRALGHEVKSFRYSDPILISPKTNAKITLFLSNNFPREFAKFRLFKNRFYFAFPDNYLRSAKLKSLIKSYQPDKIFISGGISELIVFPLVYSQQNGVPIYLFRGEHPQISLTKFEKDNLKLFRHTIINDPAHAPFWKQFGAKNIIALPYSAADPSLHHKLKLSPAKKKGYSADVVFIGTLLKDRQQILQELVGHNFTLKIYGYIPPKTKLILQLKPYYQGEAWGKISTTIYNAAKIAINIVDPSMPTGGNMRTFEIPGCGCLQITNRCRQDWYTPGKQIVLFKNNKELISKINYYLKHAQQRNRIATAAYTRTHKQHTYKHRFARILKL